MEEFKKWMCIVSLFIVTNSGQAQRTAGDFCMLRNGNRGVCKYLRDCSSAIAVIEHQKPVRCGFIGNALIVCCGDNKVPFISAPVREKEISFDGAYTSRPHVSNNPSWNTQNKPHNRPTGQYSSAGNQQGNQNGNPRPTSSGHQHQNEQNKDHRYTTSTTQRRPDRIPSSTHEALIFQNGKDKNPPTNGHKHTSGFQTGGDRNPSYVNRPTASLRKSQIKCKEYSQMVTHKVEALPLLPNPTPVEIEVARCDIKKLPLIVGGEKTVPGEFPHMAALGYQEGHNLVWNCGGTLISERYVLTAAHCTLTSRGPPVIARLGELHLKRADDGAQPRDYTINSIITHPSYKAPAKYNDIALLRLSQTVQFNKFMRPACLFSEHDFPVNKTIATGWGQIDYAEKQSDVLLKVVLDIIDNNQCNYLYRSSTHTQSLSQGITNSMMCAGVLRGGKDTCHGDSGGPIQITSGQNKCVYYVIGVTSFGKFCAAENAPGVYTRVSEYISWIEKEVWP